MSPSAARCIATSVVVDPGPLGGIVVLGKYGQEIIMELTLVVTSDQLAALERFIMNNAGSISLEARPDDLRKAYGRIGMVLLTHGYEVSR